MPEPVAKVLQTQPLPFKISGISFAMASPENWTEDGINLLNKEVEALQRISHMAIIPLADSHSKKVVTIRGTIRGISIGAYRPITADATQCTVVFDVVDPETGDVLLSKEYEKRYEPKRMGFNDPRISPDETVKLYDGINEIISNFIDDLYQIKVEEHQPQERLDGYLQYLQVHLSSQPKVTNWYHRAYEAYQNGIFSCFYVGQLESDLQSAVLNGLLEHKLFNGFGEHAYKVTLVVVDIKSTRGGLRKAKNKLGVLAAVHRDGVKVAGKMLTDEYDEHSSLDQIGELYADELAELISSLKMPE